MPDEQYPQVMRAFRGHDWAIMPEKLDAIMAVLELRAAGGRVSEEKIEAAMSNRSGLLARAAGDVAIIEVFGLIAPRANMMTRFSGGISCEELGRTFDEVLASDKIGAIVLDIDSPGGAVMGVPELADKVFAARGKKKVVAVANNMAASGAYWLAAAAEQIVVTPSGEVGSIGVFRVHEDISAAADKAGVKHTIIQAGKYKTEGTHLAPLSDDAREHAQKRVDLLYANFTETVARYRGVPVSTVRSGYGEGRTLLAQDALASGMVDRVATLEQVLAELTGQNKNPPRRGMAAMKMQQKNLQIS
jgi:signal peptide peptidase SppA